METKVEIRNTCSSINEVNALLASTNLILGKVYYGINLNRQVILGELIIIEYSDFVCEINQNSKACTNKGEVQYMLGIRNRTSKSLIKITDLELNVENQTLFDKYVEVLLSKATFTKLSKDEYIYITEAIL